MTQAEFPRKLPPYYKKRKYDSMLTGLGIGLVVPPATFILYYLILHRHMLFISFFNYLNTGNILMPIISLCVVPNLLVFFLFIWTTRYRSAQGVVSAVILYALFLAIMKIA